MQCKDGVTSPKAVLYTSTLWSDTHKSSNTIDGGQYANISQNTHKSHILSKNFKSCNTYNWGWLLSSNMKHAEVSKHRSNRLHIKGHYGSMHMYIQFGSRPSEPKVAEFQLPGAPRPHNHFFRKKSCCLNNLSLDPITLRWSNADQTGITSRVTSRVIMDQCNAKMVWPPHKLLYISTLWSDTHN